MSLTVLLDLDDTLLLSNMNDFLPAYLKALGDFLVDFAPQETIRQVLKATAEMEKNRDPSRTLEEVFDASFYPGLGIDKKDLWNRIVDFYAQVFPTLQSMTRVQPGAVDLVDHLFEQGYRVVIATNPFFPQAATFHRLSWAGLPVNRYPFTLVSTYENFHFSKPDPAYYTELMAQAGWPADPVVMVGDDYEMDIQPALDLGLPAYWITSGEAPEGSPETLRAGNVDGIIPWLKSISESHSELHLDHPLAQLAVLRSTPAALHTFTRGLSAEDWSRRPGNDEWSLTEMVCHLRDVDREVNWPRLQKVMTEDNPFLPGVATDPWAEERQYFRQDGRKALQEFFEIRTQITDLLSTMQTEDWRRMARHAIFGPTEVKELTGFVATHDRVHIGQVKQIVGV